MSPAITRKRFIAGAVCPACSEQDKIQMWEEDGVPHRECVACGYADTLNAQGQSIPKVQSVQFFPNPKLKKKPDA